MESLCCSAKLHRYCSRAGQVDAVPLRIAVNSVYSVLHLSLKEPAMKTVDADVVLLEAEVAVSAIADGY